MPTEGLKSTDYLLLLLYGATLLGIGLGSARVLTYHETNFAQPAREMVGMGDWLIPRTIGQPNTHKPPLTHWLIALCMTLFGSQAEWVCRLPSVVAALGTALGVAWLGALWYGRRVGLLSGFLQLTPFYVLMQARLAEADMLLCLWVTLAMILFAATQIEPLGPATLHRPMVWGFYAAIGLAFMTKFFIGPAFVLSGCGLYLLTSRRTSVESIASWSRLRCLLSPWGWTILLLLVLAWPLLAYRQEPTILEDWLMHNVGRFSGSLGTGAGGWFFYFYMAPAMLLPWTPWTLSAVEEARGKCLWTWDRGRFFLAWFLAGFVLLTLSTWKAKHYLLPILPALTIPTARALSRDIKDVRWSPARVVSLIGVCLAFIVFVALQRSGERMPLLLFAVPPAACLLMAVNWARRGADERAFAAIFLGCWIVGVGVQLFFMPDHDSYRAQRDLALVINERAPHDRPLHVVGLPENQIIFYLRFPLERYDDVDVFHEWTRSHPPGPLHIVTDSDVAETLQDLGRVSRLADCPPRRRHLPGLVFLRLDVGQQGN